MSLDPRQLSAFLAVVEHGSIGRAAFALHMTQPAVTRSIKRLEEVVGAQLFVRQATGMVLTSYGEVFENRARLLESEASSAIQEIRALRGREYSLVRMGAVSSAAETILSDLSGDFLAKTPELNLNVLVGLEDELTIKLLRGELDLVIAFEIIEHDDVELLMTSAEHDGCRVVAAGDHPFQSRASITLEDLRLAHWVLPPFGTVLRRELVELFESEGLCSPAARVETESLLMMKTLIVRAGYLGWLPPMLFKEQKAMKIIEELALNIAPRKSNRRFSVYKRRRSPMTLGMRKMVKFIRLKL